MNMNSDALNLKLSVLKNDNPIVPLIEMTVKPPVEPMKHMQLNPVYSSCFLNMCNDKAITKIKGKKLNFKGNFYFSSVSSSFYFTVSSFAINFLLLFLTNHSHFRS